VGGRWDGPRAWPTLRDAAVEHRQWLRGALASPPQTNEVGRSAALVGAALGFCGCPQLPVRLPEIGASAGLILRADHFAFRSTLGIWGRPDPRSSSTTPGAARCPRAAPSSSPSRWGSTSTPSTPPPPQARSGSVRTFGPT
jgi:hypothetical protein